MEYKRNCPCCGTEIIYKSNNNLRGAISKKTLCNKCSRTGKRNGNYGKVSANRGKSIEGFMSEENALRSRNRLSKGLFRGHTHTDESKKKIGEHTTQKNIDNNPVKMPGVKNKIRNTVIRLYEEGIYDNKTTSIEKKMMVILDKLRVEYIHQKKYGWYLFDFYIPSHDIYIECDGDYWHANPNFYDHNNLNAIQKNNVKRGRGKDTFMKNKCKTLLRFWECDINKDGDMIIQKLDKIFIDE